ncbi:MAG: FecR domain-containing protein [Gammaproteobacteria bacterium]|nr:FecR domain-containing protein [Gammaproteobacteria bacterium]
MFAAAHAAWQGKIRAARRRRRILAAAASLAVAAVLAAAVALRLEPAPDAAVVVRLAGTVEARPDGSDVWRAVGAADSVASGARLRTRQDGALSLDLKGVTLRVDETTTLVLESPRHVTLEGGAVYVDSGVATDGSGFSVATAFGVFEDIGTQFEIRSSEAALRLRVREGRVQLASSGLDERVEAVAGEELMVGATGGVRRRSFPPAHPDWSWAEALAATPELDGRSAYEALRWVARETGRRLVFADPAADLRARSAIMSGGRGDVHLTPEDVVQIVNGTVDGLECSLDPGAVVVRSR